MNNDNKYGSGFSDDSMVSGFSGGNNASGNYNPDSFRISADDNSFDHNSYDDNGYDDGYANEGYDDNGYDDGYANEGYDDNGYDGGYGNEGYDNNGYDDGYGNEGYDDNGYGDSYDNTSNGLDGYLNPSDDDNYGGFAQNNGSVGGGFAQNNGSVGGGFAQNNGSVGGGFAQNNGSVGGGFAQNNGSVGGGFAQTNGSQSNPEPDYDPNAPLYQPDYDPNAPLYRPENDMNAPLYQPSSVSRASAAGTATYTRNKKSQGILIVAIILVVAIVGGFLAWKVFFEKKTIRQYWESDAGQKEIVTMKAEFLAQNPDAKDFDIKVEDDDKLIYEVTYDVYGLNSMQKQKMNNYTELIRSTVSQLIHRMMDEGKLKEFKIVYRYIGKTGSVLAEYTFEP